MKNLYKELGVGSVLLVEGDPWSRDSLSMFFQVVGCRIRTAANAADAIPALSGDRFDLILCESQLPDMDGLTLLKRYGGVQVGAVIFLVTSPPDRKSIEESVPCGIHEVIRKPFTVERLEESLQRFFPRARDRGLEPIGMD